ncbi:rhotekin isoform X1 [Lates japonicus]|uniref:Rhotekin isoform X1 n=1 Tax=Lates japonicus TaxID=270547 RepID=A0AAD3N8S2_LATJO|nr:rhotekin isoform X1 [Lates japonicus]
MRSGCADGACKLLAACSQRDQALEAAKSLQTCSTRIMAYMSKLQRMKEAQVMQKVTRRSSDAGPMDAQTPMQRKSGHLRSSYPSHVERHGVLQEQRRASSMCSVLPAAAGRRDL